MYNITLWRVRVAILQYKHNTLCVVIVVVVDLHVTVNYRGADKSLARPGRKQATFPAFYGTWRFITTFTTVHHLSLP
jgi:hypothetical protein